MTEGEMAGWHHRLNGHESEQAPGDTEGQVSLACCHPWGDKESDMTERLSHTTIKKAEGIRIESSLDCKELKPGNPKGNQP